MDYPGEKLLGKMWDTLADKGMGKLLQPWQTRREGRAQADVTVFLAQAEKDANDIRAGKKVLSGAGSTVRLIEATPTAAPSEELRDGRKEPTLNLEFVVQSATLAQTAQAVREEVNVARAVLHAEATLANDSSPAPEVNVDDDWLHRWRESAAGVSSEQMQSLWGRVLAGEVKQPGNFSLRTLDFLKNLSASEARQIESISPYVFGDVIPRYGPLTKEEGPSSTFTKMLVLEELGLISGVIGTGLSVALSTQVSGRHLRAIYGRNRGILVRHADETKALRLLCYRVTPLGQEVFKLANSDVDDRHLLAVARICQQQGFSVRLFVPGSVPGDPSSVEITNEVGLPDDDA